jgi:hypothetical protein
VALLSEGAAGTSRTDGVSKEALIEIDEISFFFKSR